MLGLGVVVAAHLSAPTFAVWCLAFLNARLTWRKADDATEGMENDMNVMFLGVGLALGHLAGGKILSDFAFAEGVCRDPVASQL